MKDIKIISEHKRRLQRNGNPKPKPGFKRVMAIVNNRTVHIDIKK